MLIEGNSDLKVETKTGLGGTKICFDALINNQIDFYPEYTGTGLLVILNTQPAVTDTLKNRESVYLYVKKKFDTDFDVKWLKPIGFNNAYALMMRRKQSEDLQVTSISDLTRYLKKN
jgi:osmoprotectant transport system permease protein